MADRESPRKNVRAQSSRRSGALQAVSRFMRMLADERAGEPGPPLPRSLEFLAQHLAQLVALDDFFHEQPLADGVEDASPFGQNPPGLGLGVTDDPFHLCVDDARRF